MAFAKSFPVGKINFIDLGPMNFFEVIQAIGESSLRLMLEEIQEPKAVSQIFYEKLIKLLNYYFFIGGMPAAVAVYLKKENLEDVRIIQK